jgi:hypothetical protein
LEENITSIFMAKVQANQETSMELAASTAHNDVLSTYI